MPEMPLDRRRLLATAAWSVLVLAGCGRQPRAHAVYAELADELKLPLHAGGWSTVLSDPALRSDAIHANAQRYEQFARHLAAAAKDAGLLGTP